MSRFGRYPPEEPPIDFEPFLSTNTPMNETNAGAAGSGLKATKEGHSHPRVTSVHTGTLNSSGEADFVFTRTFDQKPGWDIGYEESANGQPVILKIVSWTQDGNGNYTGCKVKGYRGQTIPQNLATLLLGAVFNVFGGSVTGLTVSLIVIMRT